MLKTELRPYQADAVRAASAYDGFCIFPEQRTGKCLVALALVERYKPDFVFIVAPKNAVPTWESEIKKHLEFDWECGVEIITYQTPVKNTKKRKAWYEQSQQLKDDGYKIMVIADEAHQIKKAGTAQSRFVRTLGKRAQWRLALTGTPIDKEYLQFWPIFDFIMPKQAFGTQDEFKARYCRYVTREARGREYQELIGYQREPELLDIIHRYSYRITFNEARVALGKKPVRIRRKKVYFDLNAGTRRLYQDMKRDMEVVLSGLTIDAPLPVTLTQKLQQLCGGALIHELRIPGTRKKKRIIVPVGEEKITALMGVLSGLGRDTKVVICVRYTHEIEAICETLEAWNWSYKEISGSSPFDGVFDTDVIVMQVQVGAGFDLSDANTYIFYSWHHSHISFEQARSRVLNMETTEQVNYYFLLARDTIEEQYYEAVARKKDFSKLVLDTYRSKRREAARKTPRRIRKAHRSSRQQRLFA